ncbi:Innexin inx2 [Armadillidium nasatum]|uniref:Innexin n=1 Tax=Armadillidium nasatum TaxID=96803 RepID=A0A5N5TMD5_9CRUS|nr:Innexin inx2 [Armadillidium nasatum]
MPSLGGGNMDIRSILGSIVNFAKSKAAHTATAPCDGFVLKMHYRWTFFIFLAGFFSVWYNWYHRDIITCVSHFNADTQVRLDYINICLSYPFIEYDDYTRRYLLYYRWIHWVFLLLAGIYYIPRKVSKNVDNPKLRKLIEDLYQNSSRYDQIENQIVEHSVRYIAFNLKTHNGLYYKFLFINILALLIDIFTLYFLDFVLQGYFLKYGFNAYPFERDPRKFTDYMSVMFPPFATCELERANQLTAMREEKLGCHLTFMELYEKVFLLIWLWLIILMTVSIMYIIFILLLGFPFFRKYVLRMSKPVHSQQNVNTIINAVSKICKVGDIYVIYRVKQHLSHARFYELLHKLSNPDHMKAYMPNPIDLHNEKAKALAKNSYDNLRNRKGQPHQQQPQDPPINPEYLQHLLSNSDVVPRGPQHKNQQDIQQRTPLLNKNTSILIE